VFAVLFVDRKIRHCFGIQVEFRLIAF